MRYQKTVRMHVAIDADQFNFLSRLVEESRSNYSQVVREILDKVMKEKGGLNERISSNHEAVWKD